MFSVGFPGLALPSGAFRGFRSFRCFGPKKTQKRICLRTSDAQNTSKHALLHKHCSTGTSVYKKPSFHALIFSTCYPKWGV